MPRDVVNIRLVPVSGPPRGAILFPSSGSLTLGRSSTCDAVLDDPFVSRRHVRFDRRGEAWYVTDLRSRHGTCLNGVRLEPERAMPIEYGDFLSLGPWTLRFSAGDLTAAGAPTLEDMGAQRIEHVAADELTRLAEHRLSLLIDCAATIHSAADEATLAASVVEAALAGTGFGRAALIRAAGSTGEMEILGVRTSTAEGSGPLSLSRSLLREASGGQVARLAPTPVQPGTPSIISLGIHAALCAPVFVGSTIAAYLYLDSRRDERAVQPDAPAFCVAIARMAGLALGNLRRLELESRHRQLESDLLTARRAQELISPAPGGTAGPVRYAMRSMPGRLVAGDLFDVFEIGPDAVGLVIGDVSGKGAGAAILMATAQAQVRSELLHSGDPARAVASLNERLCARAGDGRFISLWVGVVHGGRLDFVDAGHGHWLVRAPGQSPARPDAPRHLIAGVERDHAYTTSAITLPVGSRLVLFSDGLIEQRDAAGEVFTLSRAIQTLGPSRDCEEDVARLMNEHGAFTGESPPTDDTTVASIEVIST